MKKLRFYILLLTLFISTSASAAESISRIKAFHHQGQTFIQWQEDVSTSWRTFNVYRATKAIKSLDDKNIECLARNIIPQSGRDFYQLKRAGFTRKFPISGSATRKRQKSSGLQGITGIELPGNNGLTSPDGGVFVYTVPESTVSYYAVTYTDAEGKEFKALQEGNNVLGTGIKEIKADPQPYQIAGIKEDFSPELKPCFMYLYAIGGTSDKKFASSLGTTKTFLFWMPASMGWRQGLPTIFTIRWKESDDVYELWPDDSNFAFMGFGNSWWYGYNNNILYPDKMLQGRVEDYSHRKLLFMIKWIQKNFPQIDRNRLAVYGASMGGTGSFCFGIRHPEIFSYVDLDVPAADVVALPNAKSSLTDLFGPMDQKILTSKGTVIWDEISNLHYIRSAKHELPFIRMCNGRFDGWMRWPPTFKAYEVLKAGKHGFTAYWYPGGHSAGRYKNYFANRDLLRNIKLHESYPAMSNCTLDENPGNGQAGNGDQYGGINLYVSWKIIQDTQSQYQIELKPLKRIKKAFLDLTPRKLQKFNVEPGDIVKFQHTFKGRKKTTQEGQVIADEKGLVNLKKIGPLYRGGSIITLKKNRL